MQLVQRWPACLTETSELALLRGVNVLIDLRTCTFTRGVNMSAPAAGKIRDDELTGSQLAVKQFYYSVVTS